jgi:hypothetical protein
MSSRGCRRWGELVAPVGRVGRAPGVGGFAQKGPRATMCTAFFLFCFELLWRERQTSAGPAPLEVVGDAASAGLLVERVAPIQRAVPLLALGQLPTPTTPPLLSSTILGVALCLGLVVMVALQLPLHRAELLAQRLDARASERRVAAARGIKQLRHQPFPRGHEAFEVGSHVTRLAVRMHGPGAGGAVELAAAVGAVPALVLLQVRRPPPRGLSFATAIARGTQTGRSRPPYKPLHIDRRVAARALVAAIVGVFAVHGVARVGALHPAVPHHRRVV